MNTDQVSMKQMTDAEIAAHPWIVMLDGQFDSRWSNAAAAEAVAEHRSTYLPSEGPAPVNFELRMLKRRTQRVPWELRHRGLIVAKG